MTYAPVIPFKGYAGWTFLQRTIEKQKAAFVASAPLQSADAYFRENIGKISSAEELVSDRRLLDVALNAFGLSDDINNRFFLKKVLEEGTLKVDSFANKLADKRYFALAKAFGFGDFSTPRTRLSDFPEEILAAYKNRKFEIAVGQVDESMRVAISMQRELPLLASQKNSENTKWFNIIGSPPLNQAFQTALGLPRSVGALDLDQQVKIFKERSESLLGSSDPAQFTEGGRLEKLVKTFLLRSEVSSNASTTSSALQLLQVGQQNRLSWRL